MTETPGLQQFFFQQIREKIPDNMSFVHEIAELLEISYDSAYRRIRGEKELSLEELVKLSKKFNLSLDALAGLDLNHVVFRKFALHPGDFSIKDWLLQIKDDIRRIQAARNPEIIYAAKDPPVFHYFHFPEIAAFKFFFWEKTIFNFPEYENKLFRLDDVNPEIVDIGNDILRAAIKIPTTEIWNEDTFRILMRQIEYYWISGYFEKKEDILNLVDKLEKWVLHIRKQAEMGFKFHYGMPAEGIPNSFMMYENEVVLNDNSIWVRVGDHMATYLTFDVISLLVTQDKAFCTNVEQHMRQLMKKSNLISVSGEKERNRFFNKLLHTIDKARTDLGLS
ncbi:MAG TPA: helix-turn-helix transcriptional regulator [Bacteroidales bacterium]|nr:helix-turn-helix transcriptional regulator [Bacteroidales bacterium]